jgi:negative regulator of flagellin synthesis FlgM
MVEIVKNMTSRLEMRKAGNSASQEAKPAKSKGSVENVSLGVELKALESQSAVKDMASAAPIDKENVNRIKDAIKRGEYPIDLDRVSDALMEAYKEMKS